MEKLFVPYELALALKNAGFDEQCLATFYQSNFRLLTTYKKATNSETNNIDLVDAPTWDEVSDWLNNKGLCAVENITNDFGLIWDVGLLPGFIGIYKLGELINNI